MAIVHYVGQECAKTSCDYSSSECVLQIGPAFNSSLRDLLSLTVLIVFLSFPQRKSSTLCVSLCLRQPQTLPPSPPTLITTISSEGFCFCLCFCHVIFPRRRGRCRTACPPRTRAARTSSGKRRLVLNTRPRTPYPPSRSRRDCRRPPAVF